ncbi:unnamed protein product [Schistosoma mattheei]|uniref:Uncharacterized protein n=1 Tax=Schistosoma mattheei TaxID=31246 RepID=A0A183PFX3_9TREM|nr:unnamed protein product [Schistosoma mattheei]
MIHRIVVGGSQQDNLDPGFMLLGTRQQGVPAILRELMLPDGFDLVSPSFTIMFGGSQQETLDPGFMLLGTRQQGVPVILRELVLPDEFDPMSFRFTVRDVTTDRIRQAASVPLRLQKLAGNHHKPERPVKSKKGKAITNIDEQRNRWVEHFKKPLNLPTPLHPPKIEVAPTALPIDVGPPTIEEISMAIRKSRLARQQDPTKFQ